MSLKWIGAIMVITGCTGFGLTIAAGYRREVGLLDRLLRALQAMRWELQYQLTPLPELCRKAGTDAGGPIGEVLAALAKELDRNNIPEVNICMRSALEGAGDLPPSVRRLLMQLGRTLGRYDLPGQLQGLRAVQSACEKRLSFLQKNRDVRLRSYQTLAVCAGVALAILFI